MLVSRSLLCLHRECDVLRSTPLWPPHLLSGLGDTLANHGGLNTGPHHSTSPNLERRVHTTKKKWQKVVIHVQDQHQFISRNQDYLVLTNRYYERRPAFHKFSTTRGIQLVVPSLSIGYIFLWLLQS